MSAYIILIRDRLREEAAMVRYADADGVMIQSFPDMVAAKAWYDSPEYTTARAHRFQAAD